MIVIGFTGKQRNGKSTVCDLLTTTLTTNAYTVMRHNFKDPLVALAKQIGWNGVKDEKGRKFLQRLGTDCVRECIDPDYWVKAWSKEMQKFSERGIDVVLTDDVRFDNEADYIHQFGGKVIFIETPEVNDKQRPDNHVSERGIDPGKIDLAFTEVQFGLPFLAGVAGQVLEYVKPDLKKLMVA